MCRPHNCNIVVRLHSNFLDCETTVCQLKRLSPLALLALHTCLYSKLTAESWLHEEFCTRRAILGTSTACSSLCRCVLSVPNPSCSSCHSALPVIFLHHFSGCRCSSVYVVTRMRTGRSTNSCSFLGRSEIFFSFPKRPDRLWGPLNLLFCWCRELFPVG